MNKKSIFGVIMGIGFLAIDGIGTYILLKRNEESNKKYEQVLEEAKRSLDAQNHVNKVWSSSFGSDSTVK